MPAFAAEVFTIDPQIEGGHLNVRNGPGVNHDVIGMLPPGAKVTSLQCVPRDDGHVGGADWCLVLYHDLRGWASRFAMIPTPIAPAPQTEPEQPPAPEEAPAPRHEQANRSGLPSCDDEQVWKTLMKGYLTSHGGYNETVEKMLIPANPHSLGIDHDSGAKFCQVQLRADASVAQEAESGTTGYHPLSAMAYRINRQWEMGNPETIRFNIATDGEGGWVVQTYR